MNKNQIILNLTEIDKEILYRNKFCKLQKYNKGKKVHKKQIEFHKCLKRNRWIFGGNRSGKTECGAVETIWLARGIHPYRENRQSVDIWVVSLSKQVQRDVAQNKVFSYLSPDWIEDVVMESGSKEFPSGGIVDYILIKNIFGNVSKIGFKSCDQGREKFQGASLDYIWFDEEPPYDIYCECKMRVLDKKGEIYGTMTPLKGLSWVYNIIYLNEGNDSEIWYLTMNWDDNPYLDKDEIKNFKASMSEQELETRCYGKFASSTGLVYPEFDVSTHVIEPFNVPKEWFDNISIDPGLNNPLSAHFYAVDYDGNIYVIAEHFEAGKDVEYHANAIKKICARLGWDIGFGGRYDALIDSAATQKTLASSKSVCELFYDFGINTNPKVNKDLFSGINRVKSYLKDAEGRVKLFIFKNCVNLIREFKSYFWGDNDKPVKADDHALDELRYYIMSRPEVPKIKKIKTEIEKDKEKLIKKLEIKKHQQWN